MEYNSFLARYDTLFQYYADKFGHDWHLLKNQAFVESSLNPDAVNEASGCKGLSQFADPTFAEWSIKLNIPNASVWDPEDSINCQAAYMKWLMQEFNGSIRMALGAYNFGIGNVKANKPWPKETIDYVNKVLTPTV